MANRFDKPHIQTTKIDSNKIANLFSIASNMDIFEIKNFSLMNKISLSVVDNMGNNLIHNTILDSGNNSELVRLEFIKFLYSENVNPDAPNEENVTPLLLACSKQLCKIVNYLVDIGVDVNYADNFNNNAYHYLFGSMIGNYKPIIQKSLFPRYKEIDDEKIESIKEIKKNIFENVLNIEDKSGTSSVPSSVPGKKITPELENIIETIKLSIGTSVDAKNLVIDFQNEYNKLLNDPKTMATFKVNDLFSTYLNSFIKLIQRNWKSFPKSGNIDLHQELPNSNSYPLGDESGLSIIKNSDYKLYIKNECDRIITTLNTDIINDNDIVPLVDLNYVNNNMLTEFVRDTVSNDFDMATLTGNENIKKEYDSMNNFIHKNCIDNADNIIDYENNTFAGGSRQVEIIDELTPAQITTLFGKNKEEIVGALAYSLLYNYEAPAPHSFNFDGTNFIVSSNVLDNNIVEYIYNIALNKNIIQIESRLKTNLSRNLNYEYLLELIEKRDNFNPGHYLYVFCCAYKGIDRIINGVDNSNLKIELRQGIVLLCSAVYHNSGDILKSLYNVFKPLLIENIILNSLNNINSIYSNFIKLLLTDGNITDDPISTNRIIDRIVLLTNEYFQNNPINFDDNDNKYLKLTEKDVKGMINSEKLGFYIVHYYSEMEHKPLLQNIVDILVLIRLFEIRGGNGNNTLNNNHFIDRLRSLYLKPITFATINNIQNDANMTHTKLSDINIDTYFKTLFGIRANNNISKIYEQISQYQIPSRINYFLYGDYEYLNQTIDNERKLFLLKQIEANHFGLNFIGLIPNLNFKDDVDNPAGGTWNTELNLFNYNRIDNTGPDYKFFHTHDGTNANDYLNRPPTYLSYFNLLQTFSNNVNELQNRILRRLREMFERLKGGNLSLYSKAIGYYYPILNALESQESFFNKVFNSSDYGDKNIPSIRNYLDARTLDKKYFPRNTFNINRFNVAVNRLNGLLFLYYYLNNNRDDEKIKIPKFLYHQLGNKPLVIFDNSKKNIIYPGNDTNEQQNLDNSNEMLTSDSERLKENFNGNYHSYNSGNDYDNIIENIQNRRFFISRDIIDGDFITSKSSKLPPSLISVYNDFLKFTINSIARRAIEAVELNTIKVEDKFIDIIPNLGNVKDIQKKLIVAKYTEELIVDYLRNNVYRIGYELFTNLIGNEEEITTTVENIFGNLDFNVLLDKKPSLEQIRNITRDEIDIIKNYYNFGQDIQDVINKIKKQYILYNNNYNSLKINKTFFKIDIKPEIILKLLNSNCNLYNTNNEGQITIINLLKYYKHDTLKLLSEAIDFDSFNTDFNMSPQKYIYNEYTSNIDKFITSKIMLNQIKNFTDIQYNDIFYNIIGNEKLGFNIINNLKLSFTICNYITQQFLSEKMYDFTNDFDIECFNYILEIIEKKDKIDFKNLFLNKEIGKLNILKTNNDMVINDIMRKTDTNFKSINDKLKLLQERKQQMEGHFNTDNIVSNISKVKKEISENREYFGNLSGIIDNSILSDITLNNVKLNVINRYNNFIATISNERMVFMAGFKEMLMENLQFSNENIIQQLLNYEKNIPTIKTSKDFINKISKFYSHLSGYCEVYFHNEYIDENPIKEFVKELLVFLTQNVICVGLETLIRKVLFEYFSFTEYSDMSINKEKVNLILDKSNFNDNNYEILAEKLVMNNTNLFKNEFEENEMVNESVNDLINNMLDNLINSSPLRLDDKVKEQLKSITPYFETIVPKTINNWRVVVENQFLFVINHSRILKCIDVVGLPRVDLLKLERECV